MVLRSGFGIEPGPCASAEMMLNMRGDIVGRAEELTAIDRFLDAAVAAPAGLFLEGEPGIGKTTLMNAAVKRAVRRGFVILQAYGAATEVTFAFAAVADLLNGIEDGLLAQLPAVQRVALDRVLLRDGGGLPTDERVAAAAMLAVVENLAQLSPVLIVIDDAHWLDPSSRAVIGFVARRLSGTVGVMASSRLDEADCEPVSAWLGTSKPESMVRHRIAPLTLNCVHALVSRRLGRALPRPVVTRLHELSGGNPFFVLELATAGTTFTSSDPPSLPVSLAEVAGRRLAAFDGDAGAVLLAIAAAGPVSVDTLSEVVDLPVDCVQSAVDAAESNGVLAVQGRHVNFTHPLLAAAVNGNAPTGRRRVVHRRLAEVVDQPELRARHLALAATSADPVTLGALDGAAESARAAGAPAVAAELTEMAIELGGDTAERRIRAAGHHFRAGDIGNTRAVIEPVIATLPPGIMRAVAINIVAAAHLYDQSYAAAAAALTTILEDARPYPPVLAQTLLSLAMAEGMSGEFEASLNHAHEAVIAAKASGSAELESQTLAMCATLRCGQGYGLDAAELRRAVDLEDPGSDGPVPFSARAVSALLAGWTGDLHDADEQMDHVARRCADRGAESDMMWVASHRTFIAVWRGQYVRAARHASDLLERAEQLGGSNMLMIAAMLNAAVSAYTGREHDARSWAQRALDCSGETSAAYVTDWTLTVLGFLEVSLGNHVQALKALSPVLSRFQSTPGTEMFSCSYLPDAIEALVATGDLSNAEPLIAALESNGAQLDRPWMTAVGARGRALWLAAKGDLEAAQHATETALESHQRLPMPFEQARTQLLYGQVLRRRRRHTQAAEALRGAAATFDEIGSKLWARRAHNELQRVTSRSTSGSGLTEGERRVVDRAAAGMSNKEIAAALFIAPKTVEMYLGTAYRKLGIRSRSQLAAAIQQMTGADAQTPFD